MNMRRQHIAVAVTLLLMNTVGSVISSAICVGCLDKCFATLPACSATPLGPVGGAACFIACEAACVLACVVTWCFDGNVAVTVRRAGFDVGLLPISDVTAGDEVLTHEDGMDLWTEVRQNMYSPGLVPFLSIEVSSDESVTASEPLVVTPNHVMVVTNTSSGALVLREAGFLQVGDLLPTAGGASATVTSIKHFESLNGKHTLVTAHGTVVANGVLTTTVCADNLQSNGTGVSDLATVLPEWRETHRAAVLGK